MSRLNDPYRAELGGVNAMQQQPERDAAYSEVQKLSHRLGKALELLQKLSDANSHIPEDASNYAVAFDAFSDSQKNTVRWLIIHEVRPFLGEKANHHRKPGRGVTP